ncbi:MAG: hypothetical protein Q4G54_04005 [Pelistega sp.]|nr:hypothetical protein [Pelistega sp.]
MVNISDINIHKHKAIKSKYSQPFIQYELLINSDYAQKLFERSADVVATACFHLDMIMPNAYPEWAHEINDLEQVVDDELDKAFHDLHEEIARLKSMADNAQLEINGKDSPTYTKKQREIIQIGSPKYARFIKLIELFDDYVQHMDTLWLHGVISQHLRRSQTLNWQSRILKIANRTIDRQRRLRASILVNAKDEVLDDLDVDADE